MSESSKNSVVPASANESTASIEPEQSKPDVLRIRDIDLASLEALLAPYQLCLELIEAELVIPGSFWGDEEAGLINNKLYIRLDTPVHSVLHEAGHYICMSPERREQLDTNAGGDYDEENGVCYLQILLADEWPSLNKSRMLADMDLWGYSFRLGSARQWFEQDAEDARNWLIKKKIIDENGKLSGNLATANTAK